MIFVFQIDELLWPRFLQDPLVLIVGVVLRLRTRHRELVGLTDFFLLILIRILNLVDDSRLNCAFVCIGLVVASFLLQVAHAMLDLPCLLAKRRDFCLE